MPIQLSGSLVITGSITTTGVITMSGSIASASYSSTSDLLQGTGSVGFTTTASFNAVSSSQQQISASYIALSGSYNTFSGSNSTILTEVSSSQQQISASLLNVIAIGATTGSNSFRANQSITGSLVVSSTITAQTLIVQTVTSSIVYSSGSNIFGCDLNSRQTFTGSVLVTGSLTIAAGGNASAPIIFGSTIACSPIGCFATSCATSFIGGTMSGTTIYGSTAVCSPVGKFTSCIDVGGTGTFSGQLTATTINGGTSAIFLNSGAQNSNGIEIRGGTGATAVNWKLEKDNTVGNAFQITPSTTNGGTTFTTPAFTLTSAGAATFISTITGTTLYGSTAVCSPVGYFSGCVGIGFTGYGGSKLTLVASANPTCASSANMQLSIGEASQNTTYSFKLGYIYVGGGYIGAIQTIAGGAASTTVINPDGGNVGIGTSSPYQNLTVLKNQNADTAAGIYNQTDGTASSTTLRFDNGSYNGQLNLYANLYTASGTAVANTLRLYTDGPGGMSFSATNQHIRFYTSPNECLRMTILYGGSVGMGNANPKHNLDICSVTTNAGGLAFCNMVTAQCVFSTFACVGSDANVVTTITYTNTNDHNRSGVFVARWAYNTSCATLFIVSCLWNDSQNIVTLAFRNHQSGALQICVSGGGGDYRVQALTQGTKAT